MPFAEIDALTSLLLVLVASLGLMITATVLFRRVVPGLLGRMMRSDDAERCYLALLQDGYLVRDRVRTLQVENEYLNNQRSRLEAELRKVQRQLALHTSRTTEFIHEINEPRPGQLKYVARLTVDASSPYARATSDSYNPIWQQVNLAEIWAVSKDDARQALDLAYPDKLGYQKMFVDASAQRAGDRPR